MNNLALSSFVEKVKSRVPWHTKIMLKLILSRLPLGYRFWSTINLFRHGSMDEPRYAWEIAGKHLARCLDHSLVELGFDVLEVGPGDSLTSAAVAHVLGANDVLLLDAGDFARHDMDDWRRMDAYLRELGSPIEGLSGARSLPDALDLCRARHFANGLADLRSLPDESVDFVWSNAVFEHIALHEFMPYQSELYRIMRPGGVASHGIDFKDHLGGNLNNLRFPEWIWESRVFARSGFYTNRIRLKAMLAMFRAVGFHVLLASEESWPALPLDRSKLDERFRALSEPDLLVSSADVVLIKPHTVEL